MSQKKISQFYFFAIAWVILGLTLASNEEGLAQGIYVLGTAICLICAIVFFKASQKKELLSKLTLLTAALISSSAAILTFL